MRKQNKNKVIARDLYMVGNFTQDEIAEKIGVTRQTVGRWAKAGNWTELKAARTVTRQEMVRRLYKQVEEINNAIDARPAGTRHANTKEADTLAKLATSIEKLEKDVGISEIISVGIKFGDFLRQIDLGEAKKFMELWDTFIKTMM